MSATDEAEVSPVVDQLEPGVEAFTLMHFTKAFIAELVARDAVSVRPHHPVDRQGFSNVIRTLDEISDDLETRHRDDLAMILLAITNELRPSNTGAFEGFEAALRAQQLTFARCPNPFYEEIEFPVPKNHAASIVSRLPPFVRDVVQKAAASFLDAKNVPA